MIEISVWIYVLVKFDLKWILLYVWLFDSWLFGLKLEVLSLVYMNEVNFLKENIL